MFWVLCPKPLLRRCPVPGPEQGLAPNLHLRRFHLHRLLVPLQVKRTAFSQENQAVPEISNFKYIIADWTGWQLGASLYFLYQPCCERRLLIHISFHSLSYRNPTSIHEEQLVNPSFFPTTSFISTSKLLPPSNANKVPKTASFWKSHLNRNFIRRLCRGR